MSNAAYFFSTGNEVTSPGDSRAVQYVARRRWTINGDFLRLKPTGIARFAHEVTGMIDKLFDEKHPLTRDLDLDIVAPATTEHSSLLRYIPTRVVRELRPRLPQVWVQLQLPRHVPGGLVSFCNLAPITVDRHIACIHDTQTSLSPGSYGFLFRLAHQVILPRLGRRADVTTTVSNFSKQNLVASGIAEAKNVVVIPNGSDHACRWQTSDGDQRWRGERPFVLCMGRNETHKNLELIWRIARRLDKAGLDIVVMGEFDATRLDGAKPRPPNLRCVGRVSDGELAQAMKAAVAFLLPSRTEGFGLPAVEAMALGCPVVASTAPCLPEICGQAAIFAGCDDDEAWLAATVGLLKKPSLRQNLVDSGTAQAARYSWRATALSYLELMASVDHKRSPTYNEPHLNGRAIMADLI